jgi:hypothetical protein|tara:strand:- start:43 stop:165 length:123 start_codon:yes stop_codon:yes gene_type:complete
MTIKYYNEACFYQGVQILVMKGLTFEADHHTRTIKLLGGF